MTWQHGTTWPGSFDPLPGLLKGDRVERTEITILNIIDRAVGLPNYQAFQPGETVKLLVTAAEKEMWEACQHVKILTASDTLPDCVKVPGISAAADDCGRMQSNDAVGASPVPRRAGRPGKVKPVNPGDTGRPETAGDGMAEIHRVPGQSAVPGTTDNLNTADHEAQWPVENVGQGGEFDGGGATDSFDGQGD